MLEERGERGKEREQPSRDRADSPSAYKNQCINNSMSRRGNINGPTEARVAKNDGENKVTAHGRNENGVHGTPVDMGKRIGHDERRLIHKQLSSDVDDIVLKVVCVVG